VIDMTHAQTPVLTVAPTADIVSLAEAKDHLRVESPDEDTLIAGYIAVAVDHLNGWSGVLGRCVITQTWRQDFDGFPCEIRLPFPDVQAATVAYSDCANVSQAFTGFHLVTDALGSKLILASGQSWPATYDRPDAVQVRMVAGYAATPLALKAAILLHVGHLYANREAVAVGVSVAELPMAYDALISPYRRVGF
jgi:uncharacterized phiE125 gp8 family phage protein